MTRETFNKMSFEEAIDLYREDDNITSYDALKDMMKDAIDRDDYILADHLCSAILNSRICDDYWYNPAMGTFDTPLPIEDKDDLERYIEETYGFID